jgi:hypothetical protein
MTIVRRLSGDLVDALKPILIVFGVILAVAAVIGIGIMLDDYAKQSLQDALNTPPLSGWHVAASGDVYVLTYPFVCGLSFHQSGGIMAVDCPNASYIALLIRSPYIDVLCNGTALYDGAGVFNGIGGEAIVYKGKALMCKFYSSGGRSHMVLPGKAGS